MKTTVKHLSDTRVVVTIALDAAELEAAEQVALHKFAKDTKVNGFRKGKAPLELVKKNTDQALLGQETLENALSKGVAEGFLNNDLQALEQPSIEVKKYVPGQEMEFTAEADVLPEITLGDHKKLKATKQKTEVTDAEVEEVIERIAQSSSEKKAVKRAAKMGDETVIDFVGKLKGEAFPGGTGNDYPLTLGSGSFIPGFEEALVGVKAGDKKDVELSFPKDYHAKDLAGKKVTFETTVKTVNEIVKPKLDDEFAANVGPFSSMKDLRNDIKREITARNDQKAEDQYKDDLVRDLVKKTKVAAPKALVEMQLQSLEQDLTQNLMYQGMNFEQYLESKGYKDRDEWVKKEAEEAAEFRVKAGLTLAELSKALKVEATSDELASEINAYKTQYANNPEMAKRFDEPEVQREIANRLITEKTVDELVRLNTK
jgi:trigger factor